MDATPEVICRIGKAYGKSANIENFENFEDFKQFKSPVIAFAAALLLAVALTLVCSPSAFAQTTPFDSQYAPPEPAPATPSETSGAPSSTNGGATNDTNATLSDVSDVSDVSDDEDVVSMLPTTGGFPLAPVLLGGAVLGGASVLAVRRRRR